MKKRTAAFSVAGVVAVLVAAYVGSSWYVGQQVERKIHALVRQYNQQAQLYLAGKPYTAQLVITDYRRGVFGSHVRYRLHLSGKDTDTTIRFVDRLVHGPLPYTEIKHGHLRPVLMASDTRLQLTPTQRDRLPQPADSNRPLAYAHTTLTFSGAGQSVWQIQPLHDSQDGLTFSGGTVKLMLPGSSGALQVVAMFANLHIDQPATMQRWQGFALQARVAQSEAGVITGAAALSADAITSRSALGLLSTTRDWSLQFDVERAGGRLDGAVDYRAGDLKLGPIDLGSMHLAAHVADVEVAAWRQLEAAIFDPDAVFSATESSAQRQLMTTFLANCPVVAIDDFEWQAASGRTTASMKLQLQPPAPQQSDAAYGRFLGALRQADIDVSLSRPMFAQLLSKYGLTLMTFGRDQGGLRDESVARIMDSVIRKLTQYGLARETDNNVQSNIHYQDHVMTLNGKELSLKEFVGRVFMTWLAFRQ